MNTSFVEVLTKEWFDSLSPKYKGYYVYMYGTNPHQPNIPAEWVPENPSDQTAYDEGKFEASRHVKAERSNLITPATTTQPPPSGTGPDIASLVKADIEARAQAGEAKYGERLRASNGRDALVDAYQEVLDLTQYLRQELENRLPVLTLLERAATLLAAVPTCGTKTPLTAECASHAQAIQDYLGGIGGDE